MSTDNHTPIPSSPNQPANAATFNIVFAELDAKMGNVATLTTTATTLTAGINELDSAIGDLSTLATPAASVVAAVGTTALGTTATTISGAIAEIVAGAGGGVGDLSTLATVDQDSAVGAINEVANEVQTARYTYSSLNGRLNALTVGSGQVNTTADGTQTTNTALTVADGSSLIDGAWLAITTAAGGIEYKRISSGGGTANIVLANAHSGVTDGGLISMLPAGLYELSTTPTFTTSATVPKIIGGTGATSALTYQTTSGVGATGADHIFLVGNNGATEAARITNNGFFGINKADPAYTLDLYHNETTYNVARPLGARFIFKSNPSSVPTSPVDHHGLDLRMESTSDNESAFVNFYPFESTASWAGSSGKTLNGLFAIYGYTYHGGAGTVNRAVNYRAQHYIADTATTNSVFGFYMENPATDGGGTTTIGNTYGLYIEPYTTGGWGVYDQSPSSYFANKIGVGTSAPGNVATITRSTGNSDSVPALGANTGTLGVFASNQAYGMLLGTLNTGKTYIQSQRVDGTATAYDLVLQPSGGWVTIGTNLTSPVVKMGAGFYYEGAAAAEFRRDNAAVASTLMMYNANTTNDNGSNISFYGDTSTTPKQVFGQIDHQISDHTHATRSSLLRFTHYVSGTAKVGMTLQGVGAGFGSTNPAARVHIDQTDTGGAIPTLLLDQADLSEEFIEFTGTVGTGNSIEAVGAKTLTTTHFLRMNITGVGYVYVPVGTIA